MKARSRLATVAVLTGAVMFGTLTGLGLALRGGSGGQAQPTGANVSLVAVGEPGEIAARAGFQPLLPASLPELYRVSDKVQVVRYEHEGSSENPYVEVNLVVKGPEQAMGGVTITQSNQKRTMGGAPTFVRKETIGPYLATVYGPPPERSDILIVEFETEGTYVTATALLGEDFTEEDLRKVIASLAR